MSDNQATVPAEDTSAKQAKQQKLPKPSKPVKQQKPLKQQKTVAKKDATEARGTTSTSTDAAGSNTGKKQQTSTNPPSGTPSKQAGQFSASDLNRIVLEYLNKKGYHQTEALLRQESLGNNKSKPTVEKAKEEKRKEKEKEKEKEKLEQAKKRDVDGNIISYEQIKQETSPESYIRAYRLLKEWVDSSLEMYKSDLDQILYPVFIYIFLKIVSKSPIHARGFFDKYSSDFRAFHSTEINRLFSVNSQDHIKENEIANAFHSNRYRVTLTKTTVNLLLFYLNDNVNIGGSLIISILNEYMELNIVETVTSKERLQDGIKLISENDRSNINYEINSTPVKLGKLPQDEEFIKEIETELKILDEKEKQNIVNTAENNKPLPPITLLEEFRGLLSRSYVDYFGKKNKGSNIGSEISEKKSASRSVDIQSPSIEVLPLPPKNALDLKIEIQKVKEYRDYVPLYDLKTALPSVCMFTFLNTNNEMLSLSYSNDCRLAAAGFKDSYIKVWSLDGTTLESKATKIQPSKSQAALRAGLDNKINEKTRSQETPITTVKLVGHSGAIYSTSFSPDNKLLVSASEDKTIRLWSMDTRTTLVTYKGHNHPVWDVQFSPVGHYFATASHDQTARLWSCDHIFPLRIFSGHISDVDCVTFHPNGCYIFTGSSDKTCRMWDITTGESVRLFIGHTAPILSVAVAPDGLRLATGSEDGVIHIWDIGTGKSLKKLIGHGKSAVNSLSYNKESNILVSGGSDNSVRIWDLTVENNENSFNNEAESGLNQPIIGYSGRQLPSVTQDMKEFGKNNSVVPTTDLVVSFYTKKTPIYKTQFTRSNIVFAGGALRD
ncbi:hypothetical protein TPHA_0L01690 [Tetrapisispora phaffii CBS 4417]|uniref:TFIID subunit TAF5 NTD2 domain-containing protein n=1 Tax=Tetrapisispora phaffii (strain ATCC 24235 / CBS 4417 / NBRC 1672 / NRRL Y-8282 / UCD 70-5) TaxID=1071381 RepID=G8C044_TETPH|nr:hypothetical protein TPHA_0L01690 [Tetrapisispora phaffii CBS 4417]CCE65522.1 hypothetical protein TPHA_0L01690 [Tetrapisispora phaffii CBS 4417]